MVLSYAITLSFVKLGSERDLNLSLFTIIISQRSEILQHVVREIDN